MAGPPAVGRIWHRDQSCSGRSPMDRPPGRSESYDAAAAAELLAYSFPADDTIAERTRTWPRDRVYAVESEGELASVILWRVVTVLDHGNPLLMALAGPGATAATARGRRVLAGSQTDFLAAMRDAGCVLSGLETPIPKWHQNNGWGICLSVARFTGAPADLAWPSRTGAGSAVRFDPPHELVASVYEDCARDRFGLLERSAADWADLRRVGPGELRRDVVGAVAEGGDRGYAVLVHRLVGDGAGLEIEVRELFHTGPSALARLLYFLVSHNNVARLRWDAPPEVELWSATSHARTWEPVRALDKLVRVVNLAGLSLATNAFPGTGVIRVIDSQAPWNDGLWRIIGDGERITFTSLAAAPPTSADQAAGDVTVQACALAPFLLGASSPWWLRDSGLLSAPNEHALSQVSRLVGTRRPPYCPDSW
ncbi:MAG: GNAT family N-acetyltransferase [Streptosporangiales bacterium]|nr:GNAT family N-acetyltransferase [Streptosporangiales bacterium]